MQIIPECTFVQGRVMAPSIAHHSYEDAWKETDETLYWLLSEMFDFKYLKNLQRFFIDLIDKIIALHGQYSHHCFLNNGKFLLW